MLEDSGTPSSGSSETFSASDFESAAGATASPETTGAETPPTDTGDLTTAPETALAPVTPAAEAPATPEKPKGPIPFEVHSKALDNARSKAKEEGAAEYRQKYGWAERISQPDLQRWGQTADRLLSDPVKYAEDLQAELEAHPVYGPQMKSATARRMQSYRQREQAQQPVTPDVQIVDADGRVVGTTYSAQALAQRDRQFADKLKAELQADMQARTAPLDKMRIEVEEKARLQKIEQGVDQQLAHASKNWPRFLDFQQQIGLELQRGAADLREAYLTVLNRDIYPSVATHERAAVLGHLSSKPAASTASPSGGSISRPTADSNKDWAQLFEEKFAQAGG